MSAPAFLFDPDQSVTVLPAETRGTIESRRHLDGGNVYLIRHVSGIRCTWSEDELTPQRQPD